MKALAKDPEFTILLARQRSGTNALRQVLGSHPEIFCTPEVFHAAPERSSEPELAKQLNFFRFLERDPGAFVTRAASAERQEAVFKEFFFQHLHGVSPRPHLVVDVKHNSTHHFDGPWRQLGTAPAFLNLVKRHRLRVLRLTRQNFLRYYVSLMKARRTEDYFTHGPVADASIEIDVKEMLHALAACEREEAVLERTFGRYDRCHTVEYAELFPRNDGRAAGELLRGIAVWLSVDPASFQLEPEYRKQSSLGLPQTISNYAEVEAALSGTKFERFLEDEPAYRS